MRTRAPAWTPWTAPDAVEAVPATETVIAELSVGESEVQFLQLESGGYNTLAIREIGSAYIQESAMDYLMKQDMTFL